MPKKQENPLKIAPGLQALAVPLERLMLDPNNANDHGKENLDAIRNSLEKFGQLKSIVVTEKGLVLAGNGTLMAARAMGATHIAAVAIPKEMEAHAEEFAIADNQTGRLSRWNDTRLKEVLDRLKVRGVASLNLGFGQKELDELFKRLRAQAKVKEEEPVVIPKKAKTKRGDVYKLGLHRLMCGDSTSAEDLKKLMDGKTAVLMNTDPPYGIDYVANAKSKGQGKGFEDIASDNLDGAGLQKFLEDCIKVAVPHLTKNAAFYLWHPMLTQGTFFAAAAAAADILISRQIIWVKPSMVFGRGDYHWRHELCFYGWRRGHKPPFYGSRNQTTVWEAGRENDKIHPTQKPVLLFETPILNHAKNGEVVYEPFAGSGAQFIAAEKHGRVCYGMELNPNYCDAVVARWEALTKKKAEKL